MPYGAHAVYAIRQALDFAPMFDGPASASAPCATRDAPRGERLSERRAATASVPRRTMPRGESQRWRCEACCGVDVKHTLLLRSRVVPTLIYTRYMLDALPTQPSADDLFDIVLRRYGVTRRLFIDKQERRYNVCRHDMSLIRYFRRISRHAAR